MIQKKKKKKNHSKKGVNTRSHTPTGYPVHHIFYPMDRNDHHIHMSNGLNREEQQSIADILFRLILN